MMVALIIAGWTLPQTLPCPAILPATLPSSTSSSSTSPFSHLVPSTQMQGDPITLENSGNTIESEEEVEFGVEVVIEDNEVEVEVVVEDKEVEVEVEEVPFKKAKMRPVEIDGTSDSTFIQEVCNRESGGEGGIEIEVEDGRECEEEKKEKKKEEEEEEEDVKRKITDVKAGPNEEKKYTNKKSRENEVIPRLMTTRRGGRTNSEEKKKVEEEEEVVEKEESDVRKGERKGKGKEEKRGEEKGKGEKEDDNGSGIGGSPREPEEEEEKEEEEKEEEGGFVTEEKYRTDSEEDEDDDDVDSRNKMKDNKMTRTNNKGSESDSDYFGGPRTNRHPNKKKVAGNTDKNKNKNRGKGKSEEKKGTGRVAKKQREERACNGMGSVDYSDDDDIDVKGRYDRIDVIDDGEGGDRRVKRKREALLPGHPSSSLSLKASRRRKRNKVLDSDDEDFDVFSEPELINDQENKIEIDNKIENENENENENDGKTVKNRIDKKYRNNENRPICVKSAVTDISLTTEEKNMIRNELYLKKFRDDLSKRENGASVFKRQKINDGNGNGNGNDDGNGGSRVRVWGEKKGSVGSVDLRKERAEERSRMKGDSVGIICLDDDDDDDDGSDDDGECGTKPSSRGTTGSNRLSLPASRQPKRNEKAKSIADEMQYDDDNKEIEINPENIREKIPNYSMAFSDKKVSSLPQPTSLSSSSSSSSFSSSSHSLHASMSDQDMDTDRLIPGGTLIMYVRTVH